MKRYIALLRGINVGGKNKIVMAKLKTNMIELGYKDVFTYLNSGNIIFSSSENNLNNLANKIMSMIYHSFNLDIPVFIILQSDLKDILNKSPDWWGNSNYENFYNEIGITNSQYEKSFNYKNIIFWSFNRKNYRKTNWWSKTANSNISNKITIRTANTLKKIAEM
jgi:uncharacterized protein (DUF1697 family)